MTKTTTLDSFQAAAAESEPAPVSNPLAELAEQMVRERDGADAVPPVGDPFAHLDLTADAGEAYGHLEARLRAWLEERGVWALEPEIRRKADELLADAEQRRPVVTEATYTVTPDGLVDGYERKVRTTVTDSEGNSADMDSPEAVNMIGRTIRKVMGHGAQELPGIEPKPLKVPSDSVFGDDGEYAVSTALAVRARTLIERHPEYLDDIRDLSVIYLWKKTGGKSKGRAVFGKTSKASGLVKHFSETQFVIWLAADHCRAAGYRDRELEALLFHEMLHMGVSEPDENTGRGGGPTLVPHELEMFRAEVEVYGLWAPELRAVAPAFQQASLFDASNEGEKAEPAADQRLECLKCGGYVVPNSGRVVCLTCRPAEPPESGYQRLDDDAGVQTWADGAPVLPVDDGAGVLIHPDGTPFTPEEIAEQEAAELRDDDYPDDDDDTDLPL